MAAHPTVDAYLAAQPPGRENVLARVRASIRSALPDATEEISYAIPAYRIAGKPVLYFAGWAKHWSLYPVSAALLAGLPDLPQGATVAKGTLRFPWTRPPEPALIEAIARKRALEATSE